MKTCLLTTYYVSESEERNRENARSLAENIRLPLIDQIFLVLQDDRAPAVPEGAKIAHIRLGRRPRFCDFFEITNCMREEGTRFIIANSDIYFNETLSLLDSVSLDNTIVLLTRWDLCRDGTLAFDNNYNCQDAWIYSGSMPPELGRFPIGQHGCDNRLLFELGEHRFRLVNPSLCVQSVHVHMSALRPYLADPNYQYVPPPYRFSLPAGLSDPWIMLARKLLRTRRDDARWYSLREYYYIRYQYHWLIWKNQLDRTRCGFWQRVSGCVRSYYYLGLFRLSRKMAL